MIKVNIFKWNGDILGVKWSEMVRFLEENILDIQEVEQPVSPVVSPEVPVVEADKPVPVRQVSAPIPERHSEAISSM